MRFGRAFPHLIVTLALPTTGGVTDVLCRLLFFGCDCDGLQDLHFDEEGGTSLVCRGLPPNLMFFRFCELTGCRLLFDGEFSCPFRSIDAICR